jgi:hypothetical protein
VQGACSERVSGWEGERVDEWKNIVVITDGEDVSG